MSDYIKREDVLNYPLRMGNELFDNNAAFLAGVECVMDYVENPLYVPTADVAPVVRCKDCVSRDFPDEYGVCCCVRNGEEVQPNDFCSKGHKMDEVTK